jgi:two-component system, OmpR family, copper resistance phosphate regulon response regulator CusR
MSSEELEQMQILLIEDDDKLASSVQKGLQTEGHEVTVTKTGEEGYFLASGNTFDVVLLDILLPGRSGLDILSRMREMQLATPVLLLTAKDAVEDRVRGLDAGADDYMVKPFAFPELLARIRALVRRGRIEPRPPIKCADLELNVASRSVRRAEREIALTPREFEVLEYLLRNQGQVVSREMLARDVWKETSRYTPLDNVIDVHIARLRRKIDDNFTPKLLYTVRGLGFIIREISA